MTDKISYPKNIKLHTDEWLERSKLIYRAEGITRLQNSCVLVCGVGGVGSFAVEALARSGIGTIILIDHDHVVPSNINRQLVATTQTLGELKVEIARQRILEINPQAKVFCIAQFYQGDLKDFFQAQASSLQLPNINQIDYVIDAIDSLKAKKELIISAHKYQLKCITALGAGNKLDPTKFVITDLFKTHNDRLARVLRRELKHAGIHQHPVVFSDELPLKHGSTTIASTSFVPPVCGMILASAVIRDLLKLN